jgi:hypothetical protein
LSKPQVEDYMKTVKVESIQEVIDNPDAEYQYNDIHGWTQTLDMGCECLNDLKYHIQGGRLYRVIPDEPVLDVECASFRNQYGHVKTFVKGSRGHEDYLNKSSEYWTPCNPVLEEVTNGSSKGREH